MTCKQLSSLAMCVIVTYRPSLSKYVASTDYGKKKERFIEKTTCRSPVRLIAGFYFEVNSAGIQFVYGCGGGGGREAGTEERNQCVCVCVCTYNETAAAAAALVACARPVFCLPQPTRRASSSCSSSLLPETNHALPHGGERTPQFH